MSKTCRSIVRINDHVQNKQPHPLANDGYTLFYIDNKDGGYYPVMLTDSEINRGIERAAKNKEDVKPLNKFFKLIHVVSKWIVP